MRKWSKEYRLFTKQMMVKSLKAETTLFSTIIGEKGFIEYLYFASCKGKKGECGNKKEKHKNFLLNINNFEVPICLYGFLTSIQG